MKTKAPEARKDYTDYNSPFVNAHGQRPYNSNAIHTEFFNTHHGETRGHGMGELVTHHWGIVALQDGRYATDTQLWLLENNSTLSRWEEEKEGRKGKPVIFATRTEALRTAGAREIRGARRALKWERPHAVTRAELAVYVNWVLQTIATETNSQEWRPVTAIPEPPPPPKDETAGLDLFDFTKTPKGETTP